MKKVFCLFIVFVLTLCSGCVSAPEPPPRVIELQTEYDGSVLDLCGSSLREYLSEDDFAAQCNFLVEHEDEHYDWQNIMLIWKDCGCEEYTVSISLDSDFTQPYTYVTESCEFYYGMFRPGVTYYWKVEGTGGCSSQTDSFTVSEQPVAIYTIDGAPNFRDGGGWMTESGRRVRYGMLYRGSQLNGYGDAEPIPESGKSKLREDLKIKSEIDLRTQDVDDGGQDSNFFAPGEAYVKAPFHPYTHIIPEYRKEDPDRVFDERVPESIATIFEFLSNEENYPVYYHCNAGADRTGTLAFLINGVLGVSYEDLTRDFEITSFMGMGNRWRGSEESGFTDGVMSDTYTDTYVAWGKMYELMLTYYSDDEDGSLSAAIENYLVTACGVEQAHIDALRDIMLE